MDYIPDAVADYLAAYRYKLELHAHTSPASGCSQLPPEELIRRLHEKGFSGVVITNHFILPEIIQRSGDPVADYLADYRRAQRAAAACGMTALLGAEYRFQENHNDYLVYGLDESFLRNSLREPTISYSRFYEENRREDLLFLQAHPFRRESAVQPASCMDGIEAFNLHPDHNSQVAVASLYALQEKVPLVTVGTDLHHPGHEGISALRVKKVPETGTELVKLLRSRDYIFEIGGRPLLPYYTFA